MPPLAAHCLRLSGLDRGRWGGLGWGWSWGRSWSWSLLCNWGCGLEVTAAEADKGLVLEGGGGERAGVETEVA